MSIDIFFLKKSERGFGNLVLEIAVIVRIVI